MKIKFSVSSGEPPPDIEMPCMPAIGDSVHMEDGTKWKVTRRQYKLDGDQVIYIVLLEPEEASP